MIEQNNAVAGEWQEAERISNLPAVHEVIQGFADDPTGDNGTMVVREVMRALAAEAPAALARVKPWKERFPRDLLGLPTQRDTINAMTAEIADLRAAAVAPAHQQQFLSHNSSDSAVMLDLLNARQQGPQPGGVDVDVIVTALYRRFKDWSKRGFGPDDVTWCEVKADVISLIAVSQPPPEPVAAGHFIMRGDTWVQVPRQNAHGATVLYHAKGWPSIGPTSAASTEVIDRPADCHFPERDEKKPAEQQGIFRKFDVRRLDGSDAPGGKHHGCSYFVLDMDHDVHAPAALRAYARSCHATHPLLSQDIKQRFPMPPRDQALCNDGEEPDWVAYGRAEVVDAAGLETKGGAT